MSSTAETATEIRPFHVEIPGSGWTISADASPRRAGPARSWSTIARRASSWRRCRRSRATGRPTTTGAGRGEAERAAAVHDRDRRGGHPLHPREVAARERAAADHDARLARLGHRAARLRRAAHRPDRARRPRRGRVRPGAAVHARLRLLRRADRGRLGPRPRRARLGGADAPPRLHPLRRPGRRRGRRGHRRDGPPGARRADRHPPQPARDGAGHRRPTADGIREGTRGAGAIGTFRTTGNGYFIEQATRPQTIGYALLDSPVGLAAWMLDHDTDSYYKISRAFVDGEPSGNLTRDHIVDNITLYWLTGTGASAARSYWENGRAASRGGRPGSSAGLGPGRLHHVPRRDLPGPAQLGRGGLSEPHLLQRGRPGRPLRRLGGAGALLDRELRRIQAAALNGGRHD